MRSSATRCSRLLDRGVLFDHRGTRSRSISSTTRVTTSSIASCSQTRSTVHPAPSSFAVCSASRSMFPRDLGAPVPRVDLWPLRMLLAAVPKAAVDKDRDPLPCECDVRSRRPPVNGYGVVDPEPEPATVERRAELALRLRVAPTYGAHVGRPRGRPGTIGNPNGHRPIVARLGLATAKRS